MFEGLKYDHIIFIFNQIVFLIDFLRIKAVLNSINCKYKSIILIPWPQRPPALRDHF